MCETLRGLRESIRGYAKDFDASLLSTSTAEEVVRDAAAIEAVAGALKALAAARASESDRWRREGYRSPAQSLAAKTGIAVGAARRSLETASRLASQPHTTSAVLAGELSLPQTALVAEGAEVDPSRQEELILAAQSESVAELKERVANLKAMHLDLEARYQLIHRRRSLRHWTDTDGAWHLHATGTVDAGAQIVAAITPLADAIFHEHRKEEKPEDPHCYAFDALLELCIDAMSEALPRDAAADGILQTREIDDQDGQRRAKGQPADPGSGKTEAPPRSTRRPRAARRRHRGAPMKVLVRVDLEALLRGVTIEGEVCELVGYAPIPVAVLYRVLETGDPFFSAIVTKGQQVHGVAQMGRDPTAAQRSALEWLSPSCTVLGCSAQARLQVDHRKDWIKTHFTMFNLLDRLCPHHHQLKTSRNWALVAGEGKRAFVPSEDPRHPSNSDLGS